MFENEVAGDDDAHGEPRSDRKGRREIELPTAYLAAHGEVRDCQGPLLVSNLP